MLVLSRFEGETITIGDDVEITIVEIRGSKVRIAIKAPTSVRVHRKEVFEAILQIDEAILDRVISDRKQLSFEEMEVRQGREDGQETDRHLET